MQAKSFQSCPTCDPVNCVAHQAPLSMGLSGKNTGVGCRALQGIFPTQGLNLCLLYCRQILYHWATGEALMLYAFIKLALYWEQVSGRPWARAMASKISSVDPSVIFSESNLGSHLKEVSILSRILSGTVDLVSFLNQSDHEIWVLNQSWEAAPVVCHMLESNFLPLKKGIYNHWKLLQERNDKTWCYGLHCVPPHPPHSYVKVQVPQNLALFGNRVIAGVII